MNELIPEVARERLAACCDVFVERSAFTLDEARRILRAGQAVGLAAKLHADQLTSVAAGSVLMDLVATLEADGRGDLVRLRHSFRAERHLVAINEAVREGDADAFAQALSGAGLFGQHRRIETNAQLSAQLRAWGERIAVLEGLRPVLDADGEGDDAPAVLAALDALARAGSVDRARCAEAIARYGIATDATAPWLC